MDKLYAFYVTFDWSNAIHNMEELVIPGWFIWILCTFGAGWIWWMVLLTKMATKALEDNRLYNHENQRIIKDISALNDKVEESKRDFHDSLKELTSKIEMLFREFQFIKGLMGKNA